MNQTWVQYTNGNQIHNRKPVLTPFSDIPELPDNYEPPEPIEVKESEEESAAPRQQHRKIFKKTSDAKPKLQRQTSQMCLLS